MLRRLWLHFNAWWHGELREQSIDEILRNDDFVRPWPVRGLYVIRDFWLREWKWIFGFILAAIGAFQLFR